MSQTAAPESQRMLAGRYAIGELLGQGGMSTVYSGTDVKLGRKVAIKIMRANLANDEQFRARFRQEAQSASRLAHPSVVRVLDAGDDLIQSAEGPQRLPFIVMEYVDGQDLREMLSSGDELSVTEACRVVDAVLSALEYSHRAGIVHRDIKPANIMITKTGQVKVMDFGIARAVSETASNVQQTTAILGTAAYFSPEQAKGETVDIRTDLYSTGVLLYELLAGQVPFKGETAVAVAYQHVSERPVAPSEHNPALGPELDQVVLHALIKDRNRRFQSASEFRQALRLAASGVMPKLRQDEQTSVLFSSGEEVSESDLALRRLSETGGATRSQSRPPVLWVWASILAITAMIAGVVFWVATTVPNNFVPDTSREIPELIGVEQQAAFEQLVKLDLVPVLEEVSNEEIEPGLVIETDPEAGARVAVDSEVTVYVSNGPERPAVPEFDRLSLELYTAELESLGLIVGSVNKENDSGEPEGRVLSVSPAPGELIERGSAVDVTVSSGKVTIPNVVGQALSVARSMLEGIASATAVPRDDCPSQPPSFPVIEQSIVGLKKQGSEISLFYCNG